MMPPVLLPLPPRDPELERHVYIHFEDGCLESIQVRDVQWLNPPLEGPVGLPVRYFAWHYELFPP